MVSFISFLPLIDLVSFPLIKGELDILFDILDKVCLDNLSKEILVFASCCCSSSSTFLILYIFDIIILFLFSSLSKAKIFLFSRILLSKPIGRQLKTLSPDDIIKLQSNNFKSFILFFISFFSLFFNVINPQKVKLFIYSSILLLSLYSFTLIIFEAHIIIIKPFLLYIDITLSKFSGTLLLSHLSKISSGIPFVINLNSFVIKLKTIALEFKEPFLMNLL